MVILSPKSCMMTAYLHTLLGCANLFGIKQHQTLSKCCFTSPPPPISTTLSSFDFAWPPSSSEYSGQGHYQTTTNNQTFYSEEDMRLLRERSSTSTDANRSSLDGHGIFAIIVFAIVALICIQPVYVPLPFFISRSGKWLRNKLIGSDDQPGTQSSEKGLSSAEAVAKETKLEQVNAKEQRSYLVFNHVWTPAIGILFLLATKTIGGEQIKLGIVGEEGVEPYDVLIFFISLAYIAISLDATGLLRYLAFQVCIKAGSNGMGLYLVLFAFFWTLGVLVGNDPVILSGTAFLVYLTRVAGISPPSAWIWAQFVAANISSAVLVSSNPTNLVIASGFEISFPIYTAYMVLPALVSAATALGVMLIFFRNESASSVQRKQQKKQSADKGVMGWTKSIFVRRPEGAGRRRSQTKTGTQPAEGNGAEIGMQDLSQDQANETHLNAQQEEDESKEFPRAPNIYIPKTIVRPDVDPRAALVDPKGAIFVSTVMAATLIIVIVTNVTGGAKVYMVAAPGAGICLTRDLIYDWYTWRSFRKQEQSEKRDAMETQSRSQTQTANGTTNGEISAIGTVSVGQEAGAVSLEKVTTAEQNGNANLLKKSDKKSRPALYRLIAWHKELMERFPTVTYVAARLPFPLLPFAFGMFILVQSLEHVGFINILAGGLGDVCGHGYIGCSFFISTLGVILCNLGGTNIGATILLTRALQSSYFQKKLPVEESLLIIKTAAYSVAFGSNVGALGGTFAASLAGLLWRDGLRQRGVLVTKSQFALWCAVVIVPALVSGVAILLPEVRYFHVS